ncbi:MAG TPA: precorrin-6A synthase (deacetylating), partial [Acidimicrobiales bacterium]|nr:precorrin-6A synthase (deacetylating) [Acidimicrobiales bacterium]
DAGCETVRLVRVIGIGAGDPDYVTVQAVQALNETDVFFFPQKEQDGDDLRALRTEVCKRHIDHNRYRIVEVAGPQRPRPAHAYTEHIAGWREERALEWERALETELPDGQVGAFLAWGDPGLYDSTLSVLGSVQALGRVDFKIDVVPGIGAAQALAARHRITLNRIGAPVLITTGRELSASWSNGITDVLVMLDPNCSFKELPEKDTKIFWGAYLGTPDEILIAGTIGERGDEIERTRTAARERKGWMFDTYLLRRPESH